MNLYLSFRSEMLKTRRTAALYLTGVAAALLPLVYLFDYATDDSDAQVLKADPWQLYFLEGWKGINFVLLPWFVILLCSLLAQIEYRNNTWKQVLASPVPTSSVFFSKFLNLQVLLVLFLGVFNTLMFAAATSLHFISPTLPFLDRPFDGQQWLAMNAKTYLAVLPISVVQFWLSLRFKNFIIPLALGLGLWFAATYLVFGFGSKDLHLFPYAYPLLSTLPRFKDLVPLVQGSALIYTALFLLLGFADFNGRRGRVG